MTKSYHDIDSPAELKKLSLSDLEKLAESLRDDIIEVTAVNGGHIGASLGCVDFIVALHKVFQTPQDCFVFDVGHQAYAHKMLTGRRKNFTSLRKENGISGFTNRAESIHDIFGAGHASTSISAAIGILEAKKHLKDESFVVAIVGDGALTGGLTFEGLNNVGALQKNLIIILNDNKISIDPNVGAIKDFFEKENGAKNYFNTFNIDYLGPLDGHNISKMIETFEQLKNQSRPVVVHLLTEKGKGYVPATQDKINFHGCGPFEKLTGKSLPSAVQEKKYQEVFAENIIKLSETDPKILAITAAMPSGTSLKKYKAAFPERFYDIGIAEAHALDFGAGLATQNMKPFVCIYSTFLQRGYDQLIHDIALQKLPVRICMDRAGVVGDDGATHQGVFDYAYLRSIPNFVVMAPKDEIELQHMMETMRLYDNGPISVRFPRGHVRGLAPVNHFTPLPLGKAEVMLGTTSGDVLICAIGEPVYDAVLAAKELSEKHGLQVSVLNLRFAKPLDNEKILQFAENFRVVVTVEEGVKMGGVGSAILELLAENHVLKPVKILGVPDLFIEQASQKKQRELCGIDKNSIVEESLNLFEATNTTSKRKTSAAGNF